MYANKYRKAEMWQNAKSTALIISFDLNNNNKKASFTDRAVKQEKKEKKVLANVQHITINCTMPLST